jgi:hypothetical protein
MSQRRMRRPLFRPITTIVITVDGGVIITAAGGDNGRRSSLQEWHLKKLSSTGAAGFHPAAFCRKAERALRLVGADEGGTEFAEPLHFGCAEGAIVDADLVEFAALNSCGD